MLLSFVFFPVLIYKFNVCLFADHRFLFGNCVSITCLCRYVRWNGRSSCPPLLCLPNYVDHFYRHLRVCKGTWTQIELPGLYWLAVLWCGCGKFNSTVFTLPIPSGQLLLCEDEKLFCFEKERNGSLNPLSNFIFMTSLFPAKITRHRCGIVRVRWSGIVVVRVIVICSIGLNGEALGSCCRTVHGRWMACQTASASYRFNSYVSYTACIFGQGSPIMKYKDTMWCKWPNVDASERRSSC